MNATHRGITFPLRRSMTRTRATARCGFRAVARILVVLIALSLLNVVSQTAANASVSNDGGLTTYAPGGTGFGQTWLVYTAAPGLYDISTGGANWECDKGNGVYTATGNTINQEVTAETTLDVHYTNADCGNLSSPTGPDSWDALVPSEGGVLIFNVTSDPTITIHHDAPDAEAPTEPTVTLTAHDNDVRVTWTGSTDNVGVTQYRYRFDDAMDTGVWTAWSSLVPVDMPNKALPHSIEVQAGDAANNWSGSAIAVWGGCSTDDVSACSPVIAPGSGANENAYCADATSPSSSNWHCIYWGQPTPDRPTHSATFNVRDFGADTAAKDSLNVIVGWSCLPTNSDNADSLTEPASEGVATFRGQQERNFAVDCGSDWIGSFYVLGGSKPSGGWNSSNDTTGTPADWEHVTLWWSYGIPGTADDPNSDTYVPSPAPVPTSGPSPHPTVNYPNDPTDSPETTDSSGGTSSCAFHWYDPTSYMCGVLNILKSLLDFVRGIEQMIIRVLKLVFIPTGSQMGAWKTSVSGIKGSGVFSLLDTMTNFVTGTFTSAQTPQTCTAETAGSYTDGHTTVSKTSPIHYCQIISNAGDEMQSSDWGSKIYLGGKILLFVYFALLWYNRISATAGSQMSA